MIKMLAKLDDEVWNTTHVVLGKRNRRSKLPTPRQLAELPLHIKPVTPIDMQLILDMMLPEAAERICRLIHTLDYDPREPVRVPSQCFRMPRSHAASFVQADIGEDIGSLDDVDLSEFNVLKYFTVVEEKPTHDRLRPITWPEVLLLLSQYVSEHKLKTVYENRLLALNKFAAVTYDLKASFHQVPLPETSRLVMVSEDGRVIRMKRLPYGADAASEIMHMIVSTLAGDPRYAKPVAHLVADEYALFNSVHIDNVYFGGPDAHQRRQHFLAACHRAGVQLNEEPGNTFSHRQTFVGMQIDTATGTVALKPNYGAKIDLEHMSTNEDLERIMGKVLYGGAVLGVNWREYLFILKQYRRILSNCARGKQAWRDTCSLWPSARQQLHKLVSVIRANAPVSVIPSVAGVAPDFDVVVACDATPRSFGGVLLRRGALPLAFGSEFGFDADIDINLAEMTAAVCMLRRFVDDIRHKHVLLLIDNTSAIAGVQRDLVNGVSSTSFHAELSQVLADAAPKSITVQYIRSEDNPADAPSRLKPDLDLGLVGAVMDRAWGRRKQRIERRARGWTAAAAVR